MIEAKSSSARRSITAYLFLISATILSPAMAVSGAESYTKILVARPMGSSSAPGYDWGSPVSEAILRYKLAITPGCVLVERDQLAENIESFRDTSAMVDDREYRRYAKRSGVPYLVSQLIEVDAGGQVQYLAELYSVEDDELLVSHEKSFSLGSLGPEVDRFAGMIREACGLKVDARYQRFADAPSASTNATLLREFGTALIGHWYGDLDGERFAQTCVSLASRARNMRAAAYLGAQAYEGARKQEKAAPGWEVLVSGGGAAFPELYENAIDGYLAGEQYDEAARIARLAERANVEKDRFLRRRAAIYEENGDRSRAQSAYMQVLDNDPKDPDALLFMARVKNHEKSPEKALDYADRLLKIDRRNGPAHLEKGRSLRELKRIDDAIEAFEDAARLLATDASPNANLGDLYAMKEAWDQAAENYDQALPAMGDEFSLYLRAANAHEHAGRARKALEILEKAENRFPDSARVYRELGLLHVRLGQRSSARPWLEKASRAPGADASVYRALGEIYTSQKEYDLARQAYRDALSRSPRDDSSTVALARLHLRRKESRQAIELLQEVVARTPGFPHINRLLGDAWLLSGNRDKALSLYEKHRRKHGDDKELRRSVADLYFDTQEYARAAEEYEKLLRTERDDGDIRCRLTLIYLRTDQLAKAESRFRGCREAGAEVHFAFGRLYAKNNDVQKAIDSFREGLNAGGDDAGALEALGGLLEKDGEQEEAAQVYEKLYRQDRTRTDFAVRAGELYETAGRQSAARSLYEEALRLGASVDEIRVRLARMAAAEGNHEKVVSLLSMVSDPDSLKTDELAMLAEAYLQRQSFSAASVYAEKILSRQPGHRRGVEIAALAYEKAGRLQQACTMYDRYLRLPAGEKHQEYAFHLGELYEQQRLTSQAVERYKTNIGAYPDDARNYERLAELYMATGKTEEALPILEKVSGLQKGRDDAKVDQMLVRARESTARSHFMAEKWPQARSAYEQLLELDRNNGDAHAKLATIHIRMGNTDAAEKHLREAQRLGRGTAQAWLELGKLYAVKEHVDKGIEALEQCIALEPHREDVLRELARLQEEKGYLEKAAATHLKLYERQPGKNVSNLTAAGVLNEKAGNTDEARRIYELFLYHGYVDAEVNVRLARIESATGRHEKTVELLEGLEGSWAAEEEVLMMLAEAHVALDQHAKAQPYVVRVVARNPRQKRALELAARVSEKIGDRHQAIKIYEKYLALPKTDRHPDMAFRLGQLYLETGDTTKAKERFNRNIASYSKDARNYENLAKIHMLAGKPAAAGVLVEKALRLPDVSADARKMMAQVQAARNNRAGAIKYYEHYLKEQPTDSVALMELGRLYRERGDYDDAVEPLVTASVLMPQRRQVHYLLGDTYVRLEKHKKSLEPLLRSRKLDSRHVPTLRGLADSYRALADTAALVEVLHTLTALEPDEYDVQYEYGVLLVRGNKANEAMPHLEKAYAIKPTTDAGMALGEACFALGKYEEVLTHLETVLVRRPKDSRVLELAAIANEKTGKLKPASLLYARYLKLPETDRHPEYAYRLGRLYEQRDMISIAMRQYQKNIDAYSRDVRSYERLARLHIGKRNFDEARPLLQKAHRLPEAPRYLSLLLAQTLEAQGELGNAVKQYQRYLKQAPDDTTALISLGALLFAREDYKRAIQPLEAAVRRTEKNVECRYMLGASYARQKKYRKAVGPLRDAHEIAPEDQRPLRALAECFRWLKDERDLIAVLEKVTVLDSTDYAARAELGELFLRRGEDKKAVPVLEAALKLKPSDVESHLTLAEIHNTRGNDSLQYRHLSLALKQAPSSAKVNKRLGIYHFGRNAMQKAARYLSRSVKYESKDAESRYLYGKALLSLGQTKSAYSQLSRAVQYDQKNARYHLERAKAAHSLRHKRNAMKAARHAVRYAPKNGDALYWMGYLHLEYGAPDSAKPYLKRAAREKKECPLCYEFLGDISARENDYREAAKHYDRALKEDEENQELAIKLGRALYNDGKYRKALKEFERLFTHKPKNNEALYWMIRSAITDNRLSLAEKIVSIHRKSNRSAWMQLAVGELDEAKGNHSSAYAGFKSAARGLSKSGPAQAAMGRGSLRKRHFKSATIYFTRALEQEPYTVEYVLGLGQAYEGRGKLGPAQVHYRQAIEMEPKNARAKFLLSGVEWERKKRTQSIKTLREAIKLDSRVGEYHLELGHRYRLMSRHKKAIDAYEKAARHGEEEMERKSYKLIGDIYYLKLKDLDKARAFYERFMKAGGKSATVAGRLKKL